MIEAAIDEAFPAPVLTATHYERFSCRGESGFAMSSCLRSLVGIWRNPTTHHANEQETVSEIQEPTSKVIVRR
jgi:6-phosphogluconate dehydrogenase (decarboxylating)